VAEVATDRTFMLGRDPSTAGLINPGASSPRPSIAEVKAILRIIRANDFFVFVLRASWPGATRFSELRIIGPAHHPASGRKFLLIRGCLFQRRVGDDKLRANQELIWDGLLGFNGALTLIALVAFTTKNFAQDNIPSFKLLVYLALAEKFSTILRRAYTTNVSRG
jgi:hypothetical protein